ncbi:ABC transporter substrate-binding protein [Bradyrhizobium sp. AZCC 2289]|uniref:ABC transporter substrate-binding protein n=1 Tax=Bradyrhizobium sp. AZCC 2289 TaxID=3117026 RepID=UPI002FF13D0F
MLGFDIGNAVRGCCRGQMRRRQFIGLAGIAAVWPLAARAQKGTALIGWLGSGSAQSSGIFVESFKRGLLDADLREGRDYQLDLRWAAGAYERFPALAKELVDNKADVILATTISAVRAAQRATSATPIVMTSITDAVGAGLVTSLAHPGGNTTGLSNLNEDLTPKLLDFFRELLPRARTIAVVGNPGNPSTNGLMEIIQAYASSFGAAVNRFELKDVAQIEPTFDLIAKGSPDAILVVPDAALLDLREQIASNALKHRIPLISTIPELTDAGALIGYGAPRRGLYRRAGYFVKRILDGAKPADLPVEQPELIEFSINSKTAVRLGIRIPDALLARADRVIE